MKVYPMPNDSWIGTISSVRKVKASKKPTHMKSTLGIREPSQLDGFDFKVYSP
jgi:hypothetical protein